MRQFTVLVATLALAVGGLLAAPAAPASAAACSGRSGVTVVVNSTVYCAPGDPVSGMAALQAVASVVQVQTQPGFVCRIDGVPAADPCVRTPPTTAYWSYWHAQPGGTWQYSDVGAASYNPAPGSVEGWSFGSGGRPGIDPPPAPPAPAPPASSASPTQPAPSAAPPATGGGSGGGSASNGGSAPAPAATSGGGAATPGATPGAVAGGEAPAEPTGADPSASASAPVEPSAAPSEEVSTSAPEGTTDAMVLTAVRDAGSPPWTAIGGGLLVLALAAAAGTVAWRRRAADAGTGAGPDAYGG